MSGPKVGILVLFVGLVAEAAVVTIPLSNDHDVIYRGNVSVGEPAQTFQAVFHTGCTLTRFPARGCSASGRFPDSCERANTYDPDASNTARPHIHPTFEVGEVEYTHFGSKGRQFYEKLSFGTPNTKNFIEVKAATIGASEKVWAFDHSVVCLSMKSKRTNNSTFYDMYNAEVMNKPWMTVALHKCDQGECEDGGAVTFGGPDEKNCESDIHWVPAILGSYMWRFRMLSVTINGRHLASNILGNVDTGNSYIHVPQSYMRTVLSTFKARKQGDYYTAACDSKFNFSFLINGRHVVVNEKHLLLKNQRIEDECVVAITESNHKDRMFVLGSAFFRASCVVHDIGEPQRVGFAAIKSPKASSDNSETSESDN